MVYDSVDGRKVKIVDGYLGMSELYPQIVGLG